jgi:hypothetical protein
MTTAYRNCGSHHKHHCDKNKKKECISPETLSGIITLRLNSSANLKVTARNKP